MSAPRFRTVKELRQEWEAVIELGRFLRNTDIVSDAVVGGSLAYAEAVAYMTHPDKAARLRDKDSDIDVFIQEDMSVERFEALLGENISKHKINLTRAKTIERIKSYYGNWITVTKSTDPKKKQIGEYLSAVNVAWVLDCVCNGVKVQFINLIPLIDTERESGFLIEVTPEELSLRGTLVASQATVFSQAYIDLMRPTLDLVQTIESRDAWESVIICRQAVLNFLNVYQYSDGGSNGSALMEAKPKYENAHVNKLLGRIDTVFKVYPRQAQKYQAAATILA